MKRFIVISLILCFPLIAIGSDDDIRRPKSGLGLGIVPSVSGGGISYLFRDDFTVAVAAGSVNGTAAVPGPGTRVAGATGEITGGNFVLAGNATDTLWLSNEITRVVGKIFVNQFTITDATNTVEFGFDTNNAGAIAGQALRVTGDLLKSYDGGSAGPQLYVPLDATSYKSAIVLTSAGAYYLLYVSNKWYLLRIGGTNNTATLYAGISNTNASGTFSFIRIPNFLWTPKPLSADSFGGTWPTTDGGGLTGIEAGGSGQTWTPSATWSISGGAAVNAPVSGNDLVIDGGMDDASKWTADAGWDVGVTTPSKATKVAGVANALTNSGGSGAVVGNWYRTSATVVRTAGNLYMTTGSYGNGSTLITGINYLTGRATTTNKVTFTGGNTFAGTVDTVYAKSLTFSQLITSINHTSTPDCYMSVKPSIATGFQAGIAFNVDDPDNPQNFNLVYYNQNDQKVYWDRCVAGTYTNQFNTAAVYSAAAPLVVRKIGTSVYVWYNDAYVNSGTAVVTTGNYHGMFQTGSGATETKLDDWFCYGSGTNGEYGILNAFSN